jgi:hypothetical protein
MEAMVQQLDKGHMRPAQKESYLCSAQCCDSAGSQAELQQCVGACEQRVMVANQLINASIKDFQVSIAACWVFPRAGAAESCRR